jgi:hypothetical protein
MKPGEDELNRVYWTTFQLWGNLSSFYSIMLNGLPYGSNIQISELEETGDELYKTGTLASMLTEPEKVHDFYEMLKKQKQQVHQRITANAKKALDAAAIVYAHGILDASAYGYLEVLSLASPDSFRIYTGGKQVSLSDVESKSYDQLHKVKIKEFMEKIVENSSLIYKLDKLHEITKPTNTNLNPEHKYEREKLVAFDKARHNIVHGNDWSSYSMDFTKEFYYWNLINFYLLRIVVEKTGLKLSREGGNKYFLGVN